MKRRNFLQKLGGTFFVAAISPTILKAFKTPETIKNNNHIENEVWDNDDWDEVSEEWTKAFFKYLKNNDVGFKWERVYSPVFELRNGHIYQCLVDAYPPHHFNILWDNRGVFEIYDTATLLRPRTFKEYRKHVFDVICSDISKKVTGKLYVYQIYVTPKIYDALNNFNPIRNICIKSVEV